MNGWTIPARPLRRALSMTLVGATALGASAMAALAEEVAHGGHEGHEAGGVPEAHLIHIEPFDLGPLHVANPTLHAYTLVVMLVLFAIALAARHAERIVPTSATAFFEWVVTSLEDLITGIIGPEGTKFMPYLGSVFLFILACNWFEVIPGMMAPTSNINTTVSLALCTFFITHVYAWKTVGPKAWLLHMVGEPRWLAPLMFPIHVVGEFAKPLSLSMRLFGNIMGKGKVVAILFMLAGLIMGGMSKLGWDVVALTLVPCAIALAAVYSLKTGLSAKAKKGLALAIVACIVLGLFPALLPAPLLVLAIFMGFLQAFVFTLLSTMYIALMSEAHEEHAEHDHAPVHSTSEVHASEPVTA